jgi:DNA-binding PadR family transcriptional regulator
MSRDFTPGDFENLREQSSSPHSPAARTDVRQPDERAIPRQEPITGVSHESAPDPRIPDPRFHDRPHLRAGRDRDYSLRQYEEYALADIGRFRIVAKDELSAFLYEGHRDEMERDLWNLKRQGLIQSRSFEGSDGRPREMLALTKSGYRLLRAARALPEKQTAYYGFVKPKEANHDADIYRVYREEGARISREGGTKLRVILDFELKKRLNRDFATFGAESREQIAARHGLRVVNGKIPVPDLRIEYETREGDLGRVDLELATEHYRPRQLAEKARAGFSIYTHAGEADHLRRVLEQRELTAEILTL